MQENYCLRSSEGDGNGEKFIVSPCYEEGTIMGKTQINPWRWQDVYGFSQAWKVDGARSLIFVSGKASISPEGTVMHQGDFRAQARLTFENLHTVLKEAGASLEDIVKLGVFLVNMGNLPDYGAVQAEFFRGSMPAQTVVQINSLALPGMMIEVEAVAVQ
jgi:2-iminobutanoate/2-iminopropanoate deaminase